METTTPGSDATGKEMVPLKDEEFKDPKQDKGPLLTAPVLAEAPSWQARHPPLPHWQWQQWHWQNQHRIAHPHPNLHHFQPRQISLQPPSPNEVQGLQGPESLAGKKFRSIQELDDAMKLRSRTMESEDHNGHVPAQHSPHAWAGNDHMKSKMPLPPPPPPPPPPTQVGTQAAQGLQGPESSLHDNFLRSSFLTFARWDDNADRHGAPALSRQRPGNEGKKI